MPCSCFKSLICQWLTITFRIRLSLLIWHTGPIFIMKLPSSLAFLKNKNSLLPTCYATVIVSFMDFPVLKVFCMTPPSLWVSLPSLCHLLTSYLTLRYFAHLPLQSCLVSPPRWS